VYFIYLYLINIYSMRKKISKILSLVSIAVLLAVSMPFGNIADASKNQSDIEKRVDAMLKAGEEYGYDGSRIVVKFKDTKSLNSTKGVSQGVFQPITSGKNEFETYGTMYVVAPKEDEDSSQRFVASTKNERLAVRAKLIEALKNPNVESAQPNYIYKSHAWTQTGTTAKPSDYNDSRNWYYNQAKLPEMWKDQACPGGANCGGKTDVVVAVIDSGLAFESYDDTGSDSFYQYLYNQNLHVCTQYNSSGNCIATTRLGANGGKNFTAISPEYNIANGFKRWTNPNESGSYNNQDTNCDGVVDDRHGVDTFALYETFYFNGSTCGGGCSNPDILKRAQCEWMGHTWSNGNTPATMPKVWRKAGHPVDTFGHGSYVTGLISGAVDNETSTPVSPAFNVSIMSIAANIPFMNAFWGTDIANGIMYAALNGADVINMSLGGPYDDMVEDAVNFAHSQGVVMIASSGNENTSVAYPAAYTNVIAVGSVNSSGARSSYSNYGSNLDLVAYVGQGSNAGTATYQQTLSCFPNCTSASTFSATSSQYGVGTSYAAPQVAAAAAIIIGNNPGISPIGVRNALSLSVEGNGWNSTHGNGILNFQKANEFTPTVYNSMYKQYLPLYRDTNSPAGVTWTNISNPGQTNVKVLLTIGDGISRYYNINAESRINLNFPGYINGPVTVYSLEGQEILLGNRTTENGSFDEVLSIGELDNEFIFSLYRDTNSFASRTWISVGNPNNNAVNVNIKIGGATYGPYTIPANGRINRNYPGLIAGPVVITSVGGENIIASLRQTENGTFDETIGVTSLASTYYMPLYRDTNSSAARTWISVGNPNNNAVNVNIKIGETAYGPYTIPANGRINRNYPGLIAGPVVITSVGGENIIASLRQTENGHFDEAVGLSNLSNKYMFPLYRDTNSFASRTWISVGNPNNNAVNVNIKIGGTTYGPYTIPANGRINRNYPGLIAGPVVITSVGGENIIASLRQTENGSFDETIGIPKF
jgi:hypothetical protein